MKENIDDILAKILNKEPLTKEEKQLLEEWKHATVRNEKVEKIIQKLEHQKKILDKHQKEAVAFTKVEKRIRQARRKRQFIYWSSCAASIILLVGFFLIFRQENTPGKEAGINQTYISGLSLHRPTAELIMPDGKKRLLSQKTNTVIVSDSNKEMRTDKQTLIVKSNESEVRKTEYYTMNVPLGAEYNLVLPDGTKIYLNAGSSLRYPDQFIGGTREVYLIGEAYFEVTPDSRHPFIVHTGEVAVRVLGTAFNVNAYPEGAWVKTTLVEGRVETQCGDNNFVMKPGMQVAYNKETRKADYFPVNTRQYTSWKDGYYEFEDMPLGELMQIFTRWYNVNIEFADSNLKEIKFSGRLKRYDDLLPLFKMLEYTRDIRFIVANERIIIQKK
ncbi:FecR domain-containing protein [Butyricimonas sp.]|uniref:FecR family protein n=1 Tax=Butyricimonas sp. TaxID=1969738 RepID=UPI0025BE772C|nr:FecR domain-containing protein [Butyricimonas sp.]